MNYPDETLSPSPRTNTSATAGDPIPGAAHETTRATRTVKDQQLTNVRLHGWRVEVNLHTRAVSVPMQDASGLSAHGLADCLDQAYLMVGIVTRHGARLRNAAIAGRREPARTELLEVLETGREIAARVGRRTDVFTCARAAWQPHGAAIPFALVTAALRGALPAGTTLTRYSQQCPDEQLSDLFDRASADIRGAVRITTHRGVA